MVEDGRGGWYFISITNNTIWLYDTTSLMPSVIDLPTWWTTQGTTLTSVGSLAPIDGNYNKKREVRLKRNNALLQKQIHKLTEENKMLQSEVLSAEKMKSIIAKVDGKTYSTTCHKAIYSCLEYQVPVTLKALYEYFAGKVMFECVTISCVFLIA